MRFSMRCCCSAAGLKSAAGAAGAAAAAAATAAGTGDRFAAHVAVRWQGDRCDGAAIRPPDPVSAPDLAAFPGPAGGGWAGAAGLGFFEQALGYRSFAPRRACVGI